MEFGVVQFALLASALITLNRLFPRDDTPVFISLILVVAAWRASKYEAQLAVAGEDAISPPKAEEVAPPSPPPPPRPVAQTSIPEVFRFLSTLHNSDRPFEAVAELERLRKSNPSEFQTVSPELQCMFVKVDTQRDEIFRLTNLLEQEENWKFRMHHKGSDVFLSIVDSRDFKVVTRTKASLYNIISLVYETDLYKDWVPGVDVSSRWKQSTFNQYLYLRFPVPFPMKPRDVVLKGYGDVRNGGVMIYVGSVENPEAERALGVKNGPVRVEVVFGGFLLRPIVNTGEVEITMLTRLDLKLPLVPEQFIDYAAKFVLCELINVIRDKSMAMTTSPNDAKHKKWRERQTGEDAGVYKEVENRLAGLE